MEIDLDYRMQRIKPLFVCLFSWLVDLFGFYSTHSFLILFPPVAYSFDNHGSNFDFYQVCGH